MTERTSTTAATHFVAVTKDPIGSATIFGIGTTCDEATADAARWGDPSERPAEDVWKALPATKALYDSVKAGNVDRWGQIEIDGLEVECTTEEEEAQPIAKDILRAVGQSIDGGSELEGWNGEEAIDAYAEGSSWEDDVKDDPALRAAVAAAVDAELAVWRAEAASA